MIDGQNINFELVSGNDFEFLFKVIDQQGNILNFDPLKIENYPI